MKLKQLRFEYVECHIEKTKNFLKDSGRPVDCYRLSTLDSQENRHLIVVNKSHFILPNVRSMCSGCYLHTVPEVRCPLKPVYSLSR